MVQTIDIHLQKKQIIKPEISLNLGKTRINLDYNSIGAEGCRHLSQAKWEHLTTLKLCKTILI